ncbi:hypothetical protein [Subtercola sp. Z020]|uniref:hypothetical protein n=1 Tax=Subtercola sp. Z020 TaxID=2080582 RepID=UPI0011B0D4DE|nr:hypothetical protein [Subtercola sp. Z020]
MPRPFELPPALRGDAFSRADALRRGLDDNRLRRSDLAAPFTGIRVVSADRPTGIRSLCEAYAPRLRPGQYFSHRTAALLWELPSAVRRSAAHVLDVSVTAEAGWPPTARGVRGHVLAVAPRVVELRGLPVCDAASVWIQLGSVAGVDELVAVGDAAVYRSRFARADDPRPFTTIAELSERLTHFRGRGKRRLESALALVREGVESPMETALRLLLVRGGLPEPEINVDLYTGSGEFAGRADLYYREFNVVVEYDGEQHRLDRAVYASDQRRITRLLDLNAVVRVRVEGLRSEAHLTLAEVRAALTAAGWRPIDSVISVCSAGARRQKSPSR